MPTSYPILPRPLDETPGDRLRVDDTRAGDGGVAAADTHTPQSEPTVPPPRSLAQALAPSQPAGWDPREVWLNRVHKPREGRRTW